MMKFRPSFLLLATKFPTTTTSFVVPAATVVAASHFSTKMKAKADRSIAVEEDGSTRAVHDDSKEKPVMNKKTEKPAQQGLQRTPQRGWLSPWAGFDVFRNDPFFTSDWDRDFFHEPMSILKSSFFDDVDKTPGGSMTRLLRSSPGYEIKEDDKTYQIAVAIPEGVGLGDIHVNLEQDGKVLHVAGQRKVESKNGFSETRFDQRFTIGSNVDTDQLSANFHDGVLVVQAPKNVVAVDDGRRKIAITQQPHHQNQKTDWTDEEIRSKTFSDEFDESDLAERAKQTKMKP